MKSLKTILEERKRTYDFRVIIANVDLNDEMMDKIENVLSEYKLCDITKPKSYPISRNLEFALLGPVARQEFDIQLNYPTIPPAIAQTISINTKIPIQNILVRNIVNGEVIVDNETSIKEKSPILNNNDLPQVDDSQNLVGMKRLDSFIKELEQKPAKMTQYKGINDNILADKEPIEKRPVKDTKFGTVSPIGSNKTKLPPRK